jgi:hypothetical protein
LSGGALAVAIFCAAESGTLFDHQVGDSTEILVLSASKRRGIIKFRDQHCPGDHRSWISDRDHIYEAILALLFLGRHDVMRHPIILSFKYFSVERIGIDEPENPLIAAAASARPRRYQSARSSIQST